MSRLILITIFLKVFVGSLYSQTLTVAFTRISSLEYGSKVNVGERQIGHVADIKPSKDIDTLFVVIKLNQGVKVPKGSVFYLNENVLGPSQITVEYSREREYLTSKDISFGVFRPLSSMIPEKVESIRLPGGAW